MANGAIPSFEEYRAQQGGGIPSFDEFKAANPPQYRAHQKFLDYKAAHPNDSTAQELNTAPDPEAEALKASHPHIVAALKFLFNDATPAPGVMAVEGPVAAAAQSPGVRNILQQVMDHPKTVAAMRDTATELFKEIPGVKTLIKASKGIGTAKDVFDDIRGAQAVSEVPMARPPQPPQPPQPPPGSMTIQPQALQRTTPPTIPGTPVQSGTVAAHPAMAPQGQPPAPVAAAPVASVDPILDQIAQGELFKKPSFSALSPDEQAMAREFAAKMTPVPVSKTIPPPEVVEHVKTGPSEPKGHTIQDQLKNYLVSQRETSGPVTRDNLTDRLNSLLRENKIAGGFDPDVPLGEVKGGQYLNRFGGSDSPVIDSSKRRVDSTASVANPSKLKVVPSPNNLKKSTAYRNLVKRNPDAARKAMELAQELDNER